MPAAVRALLVLAVLLAVTPLAEVPATAEQQAGTTATAQPRDIRVATYNIRAGVRFGPFSRAVTALQQRSDVIGLQEMGANERRLFLNGSLRWEYFRSPLLQQNPIVWDRLKFRFLDGEGVRIAKARDLHGEIADAEDKKDSMATVIHLQERQTGQRLSFVNVHLVHGAVKAGRPWPGHPHTFGLYVDQVRGLRDVVRRERRWGRVFVLGDFNVGYVQDARWQLDRLPHRAFTDLGLRSMWRGSRYLSTPYGTHDDALIDGIWSEQRARDPQIVRSIRASDHAPAVATFRLPAVRGHVPVRAAIGMNEAEVVEGTGDGAVLRFRLDGELGDGSVTPFLKPVDYPVSWRATPGVDAGEPVLLRTADPYVSWVEVPVVGDADPEDDEVVTLRMRDVVGVRIWNNEVYGTIHDDD